MLAVNSDRLNEHWKRGLAAFRVPVEQPVTQEPDLVAALLELTEAVKILTDELALGRD